MGIMVCSLLWVMQDVHHQPYGLARGSRRPSLSKRKALPLKTPRTGSSWPLERPLHPERQPKPTKIDQQKNNSITTPSTRKTALNPTLSSSKVTSSGRLKPLELCPTSVQILVRSQVAQNRIRILNTSGPFFFGDRDNLGEKYESVEPPGPPSLRPLPPCGPVLFLFPRFFQRSRIFRFLHYFILLLVCFPYVIIPVFFFLCFSPLFQFHLDLSVFSVFPQACNSHMCPILFLNYGFGGTLGLTLLGRSSSQAL